VLVSDFNYQLPAELIAQQPLPARADSRLLHLNRASQSLKDACFHDFPGLLSSDDLLVFNNTRVFSARLFGKKGTPNGGSNVEVLLTRQTSLDPNEWQCLVKPGRQIRPSDVLRFGDNGELRAEVIGRSQFGERIVRFEAVQDFLGLVERIGHIPLPPYISRDDGPADKERYQTVYARERGSIAAPTAGLHFTPEILDQIKDRGIETAEITLHVGLGTFQPVRTELVEEHKLHRETYCISPQATEKIKDAKAAKRRIVAVGTTTVRTLEYAASLSPDGELKAGQGEADIFIYPGYKFRIVDALLTNFHLPKSSLLILISAFAGREQVLAAYHHAVAREYRFYSYGDCMFIE
jgi:S-adenosylmethionine:tRNA ribosyltransferase-isomerase